MEIEIKSNCEFEDFYTILDKLKNEDVKILKELHDFDSVYVDFSYVGNIYTIYYNIYCGIVLYPQDVSTMSKNNEEEITKVVAKLKD